MNYEIYETFEPGIVDPQLSRPAIPLSVYQPVKRCPHCQSVYLTDLKCEACGRALSYHPIGEPFSAKSLYGFKERHYASFPLLVRYFPFFENKTDPASKSYMRNLTKRFDDLLFALGESAVIENKNRRFFYVEMLELIDEMLRYGTPTIIFQQKLEEKMMETGPLLSGELLTYLNESQKDNQLTKPWFQRALDHRLMGLRVDYILKVSLTAATVVAIAVVYYQFINLQFGR